MVPSICNGLSAAVTWSSKKTIPEIQIWDNHFFIIIIIIIIYFAQIN